MAVANWKEMETKLPQHVWTENVWVLVLFVRISRLVSHACCKGKFCNNIEPFYGCTHLQCRPRRRMSLGFFFRIFNIFLALSIYLLICMHRCSHLVDELFVWWSTSSTWYHLTSNIRINYKRLKFFSLVAKLLFYVDFFWSGRLLFGYALHWVENDVVVDLLGFLLLLLFNIPNFIFRNLLILH